MTRPTFLVKMMKNKGKHDEGMKHFILRWREIAAFACSALWFSIGLQSKNNNNKTKILTDGISAVAFISVFLSYVNKLRALELGGLPVYLALGYLPVLNRSPKRH